MTSSSYPMISVDLAISIVIREVSQALASRPAVSVPINRCHGYILAENIFGTAPVPEFPTSIMDGYAVHAPFTAGSYPIQGSVHAGSTNIQSLRTGHVQYITTGGALPPGTNAVIKIEDTDPIQSDSKVVNIKVSCDAGTNVREIGSDLAIGELVLSAGSTIGSAEIGLLCCIGRDNVMCYPAPIVGVMSTGDELVNAWETPTGTQIRDSNRAAVIASFEEDRINCVDLGIVSDSKELIKNHILSACERCDVVITSGGVSMGNKDFVKPLLAELGTVHFGRLNMKPGKPTTFASIVKKDGSRCFFFGLPGNPVSCLVTSALMVSPAVKLLRGVPQMQCLHTELKCKLAGPDLKLDPERVEYHRYLKYHVESYRCVSLFSYYFILTILFIFKR